MEYFNIIEERCDFTKDIRWESDTLEGREESLKDQSDLL